MRKNMCFKAFSIMFCLALGMVGCKRSPLPSSKEFCIVSSFPIIAHLVDRICSGDMYRHHVLVSGNADPHTYQPSPKDAQILSQANVVVCNGLGLEGWLERMIEASGFSGLSITASARIKARQDEIDPHAWHDPQNLILYAEEICLHLSELKPSQKALYEANFKELKRKLELLHTWILHEWEKVPLEDRVILTTHDAFWYYGKAYRVTFLSPIGINTDTQPSAQDMANLIRLIQSRKIKAIFIENLSSPQLIQQLAEETGNPICGTLYADSLPDSVEDMIRYNTDLFLAKLIS